jgi:hypothetical protein
MSTNLFLTVLNGITTRVQAIASSAGVADGSKIVATAADGRLDSSLMPVGIGPATQSVTTSEALTAGDFVNLHDATGTRARKADSSNARPAHGFVLASAASGANAIVYLQGSNTGLTGLTPGQIRYLGTAGATTATAPSTASHIIQQLGVAVSASAVNFEYNDFIQL